MFSRIIIFTFMIGLVTCGQNDFDITAPLKSSEFQACQFLCEEKGKNSLEYCLYTVSISTSHLIEQSIQRCYRILEGMVTECIREQCSQNNKDSPQVLKDFLTSK